MYYIQMHHLWLTNRIKMHYNDLQGIPAKHGDAASNPVLCCVYYKKLTKMSQDFSWPITKVAQTIQTKTNALLPYFYIILLF